ncbi:alternative ribosome rescue aminoacyl-tRNA hydrolase ArfB [Frankia sp. AgB32]|uniref:alternative ribosome rescue aminoacyl-tRNA hydrolase ArfB n=1 Tax=Frankia sp. AgB32 TaxID=631119 RepID=UPI00200E7C36|nr:alternative ribosome rescue aminoacyl-tRNA hydrolase ArfB [Frankia sp. AgB32]MCK9893261.1 aminoacyl-tRNA hydrolase [Frankia sp. AgB32]
MVPREIQVRPGLVLPAGELRWRYSRSSGPGGQGVNTADSRVELSFDLAGSPTLSAVLRERAMTRLAGRLHDGVLTIVASEHRSQLRNREAALERLVDTLQAATARPPRARRATAPSRGSVERRLQAKKRRSSTKRNRRSGPGDE